MPGVASMTNSEGMWSMKSGPALISFSSRMLRIFGLPFGFRPDLVMKPSDMNRTLSTSSPTQ